VINRRKEYEIADALHKGVVGLPAIRLDSTRAMEVLMDVLQHLATFKFFEGLENRLPKRSVRKYLPVKTLSYPITSSTLRIASKRSNLCEAQARELFYQINKGEGVYETVGVETSSDDSEGEVLENDEAKPLPDPDWQPHTLLHAHSVTPNHITAYTVPALRYFR